MSNRAVVVGGGVIAAGAAYYLYQAGGDPKAAEKRVERDAAKLSSSIRNDLPGKGDEVKGDAKVFAADAGKKVDDLARSAKQGVSQVDSKLEHYRQGAEKSIDQGLKETRRDVNSAVDKFDKNVTEGASKAKSGISNWFGGK